MEKGEEGMWFKWFRRSKFERFYNSWTSQEDQEKSNMLLEQVNKEQQRVVELRAKLYNESWVLRVERDRGMAQDVLDALQTEVDDLRRLLRTAENDVLEMRMSGRFLYRWGR